MNDTNQDRCLNVRGGKPGAFPIPKIIDEKSPKRGMEPELVNIAVACDRVVAISCREITTLAFLHDVTNLPSAPILSKILNLSPTSQFKVPCPVLLEMLTRELLSS